MDFEIMSVLLCHIVWMPHYSGESEVRAGGFDYVREQGFGHELFNYVTVQGVCYGYVQSMTQKFEGAALNGAMVRRR
jgi:hypothetical protein